VTTARHLAQWAVVFALLSAADAPLATGRRGHHHGSCSGDRPPLPDTLTYELRAGAFPGSGRPDVAVHVPPGFDATRRPGVVVYLHGWNGCVTAALSEDDVPCSEGGDPRTASALARQMDEARANAILVAVELRADMPTGEPGHLADSGGMRALLHELLSEHLAEPLGCTLDVDELDRIVVIAHSGGYQAAASVLVFGELPQITEVDLLDAYYGADDVFTSWALDAVAQFDGSRRFVDIYTAGGGTLERSRAAAKLIRKAPGAGSMLLDDDGDADLSEDELAFPVVVKRVPRSHAELPRAYFRALVEAAGFVRLSSTEPELSAPGETRAAERRP
jgi:hypothetical protein